MGKSKARILRKGINNQLPKITRQDATDLAVKALNQGNINEAKDYITMFCMTGEELLEAGASYESVVAINNILTL